MTASESHLRITPPRTPLAEDAETALRDGLDGCPDLAFAHLVDVEVVESGEGPGMVLFAWVVPAAMRSMRAALNLLSDTVAKALPRDRYIDIVILNSAPELLSEVEQAGCLFVEPVPDERQRALASVGAPDLP